MKLYVSKNLLNLLNHVKTGHYNTKRAFHWRPLQYILYIILFLYSLIYGKDVILKEEAWVAFLTSNTRFNTDFPFLLQILHISFLKAAQSYEKQLWDWMKLLYMIYETIKHRKLVYFCPFLCTYITHY